MPSNSLSFSIFELYKISVATKISEMRLSTTGKDLFSRVLNGKNISFTSIL